MVINPRFNPQQWPSLKFLFPGYKGQHEWFDPTDRIVNVKFVRAQIFTAVTIQDPSIISQVLEEAKTTLFLLATKKELDLHRIA